ncbi:MAG: hypothetical protein AAGI15_07185 [Pseudomonadota bacterium]
MTAKPLTGSTAPRALLAPLLLSVLLGPLSISAAHAGQLYRFKSAEGGTVLSSSIPNERVAFGYDVIDSNSGRVLRKVAPQLTPEEAAIKAEHERRVSVCEVALRRVRNMYESPADIDNAETKALQSLETRVVNAQANLTHIRNQRTNLEEQAARLERNGTGINPALMGNLERAGNQIANLEQEIEQRKVEREETLEGYALDRTIFAFDNCEAAAVSAVFDGDEPQLAER